MSKRNNAVTITPKEDAASFGYVGGFIGFFVAYLGAEITLALRPHPIHWLVAGIGAIVLGATTFGFTFWQRTRHG